MVVTYQTGKNDLGYTTGVVFPPNLKQVITNKVLSSGEQEIEN